MSHEIYIKDLETVCNNTSVEIKHTMDTPEYSSVGDTEITFFNKINSDHSTIIKLYGSHSGSLRKLSEAFEFLAKEIDKKQSAAKMLSNSDFQLQGV